jgi:hypothetical protein
MSDNLPKTLPTAGAGGFLALTLTDQLWVVIAIFIGTFIVVSAVRALWRRGKTIDQA